MMRRLQFSPHGIGIAGAQAMKAVARILSVAMAAACLSRAAPQRT